MGVESIKRQTRAAYGCLVEGQSPWARAWTAAYRLYAHCVCDTKVPLQLRLEALHKCYMPLPLRGDVHICVLSPVAMKVMTIFMGVAFLEIVPPATFSHVCI